MELTGAALARTTTITSAGTGGRGDRIAATRVAGPGGPRANAAQRRVVPPGRAGPSPLGLAPLEAARPPPLLLAVTEPEPEKPGPAPEGVAEAKGAAAPRSKGPSIVQEKPASDGYNWRKYGQKNVKGTGFPRSYYKCTHPGCAVKKKVERSATGEVTGTKLIGVHNHDPPAAGAKDSVSAAATPAGEGAGDKRKRGALAAPSAGGDGQSPSGSGAPALEWDDSGGSAPSPRQDGKGGKGESAAASARKALAAASVTGESAGDAAAAEVASPAKKRRVAAPGAKMAAAAAAAQQAAAAALLLQVGGSVVVAATRPAAARGAVQVGGALPGGAAPGESRLVVHTESEADVLDDGYRWRKYGQKLVKGSPFPRSYYKCTAPSCPVRKHVERSAADSKNLMTTYEGAHNHPPPAAAPARGGKGGARGGGASRPSAIRAGGARAATSGASARPSSSGSRGAGHLAAGAPLSSPGKRVPVITSGSALGSDAIAEAADILASLSPCSRKNFGDRMAGNAPPSLFRPAHMHPSSAFLSFMGADTPKGGLSGLSNLANPANSLGTRAAGASAPVHAPAAGTTATGGAPTPSMLMDTSGFISTPVPTPNAAPAQPSAFAAAQAGEGAVVAVAAV